MSTTAELIQQSKPQLAAHLEVEINWPWHNGTKTVYRQIIAPTKEYMDLAILNYAGQCGAISVKTITPEEFQNATNT